MAKANGEMENYSDSFKGALAGGFAGMAMAAIIFRGKNSGRAEAIVGSGIAGALVGGSLAKRYARDKNLSEKSARELAEAVSRGADEEYFLIKDASSSAGDLVYLHSQNLDNFSRFPSEKYPSYVSAPKEIYNLVSEEIVLLKNVINAASQRLPKYEESISLLTKSESLGPQFFKAESSVARLEEVILNSREILSRQEVLRKRAQLNSDECLQPSLTIDDSEDDTQDPGPGCFPTQS